MPDARSDRDKANFRHPLANVFLQASDEGFRFVKDSVATTGPHSPIKLTEENKVNVFDGWNCFRVYHELDCDASPHVD